MQAKLTAPECLASECVEAEGLSSGGDLLERVPLRFEERVVERFLRVRRLDPIGATEQQDDDGKNCSNHVHRSRDEEDPLRARASFSAMRAATPGSPYRYR